MKLNEIFVDDLFNEKTKDLKITDICNDSRLVTAGALFLAYPGNTIDGRKFINDAIKNGAHAIAYDPENFNPIINNEKIALIAVPNLLQKITQIAGKFYEHSDQKLITHAVTGTNGKTTTAYLLAQAFELLGENAAYIGTLGEGDYTSLNPLNNTTPDGLLLHKLFNRYCKENKKHVCMEVSSHSLTQHRVSNINFKHAIYTNLSHEHLDYHKSIEEYAKAKAKLFAFASLDSALINYDDAYKDYMVRNLSKYCKKYSYAVHAKADIYPSLINVSLSGIELVVQSPWGEKNLQLNLLGEFNIYNSLAVFGSLMISNIEINKAIKVMSKLKSVPGRMQVVSSEPYIIIDYAHTPDALFNVITTLNKLKRGKLFVVFGCGGNRDREKRPLMGEIATKNADVVIVTSDNPRTEEPGLIIKEIVQNIEQRKNLYTITNREEAIIKALNLMDNDDILLIAGKGHEAYQEIGNQRMDYSDEFVVQQLLQLKKNDEALL